MRFSLPAMRELVLGPAEYQARSPWNPALAVVATLVILATAAVVATALLNVLGAFSRGATNTAQWGTATWLLGMQASVIALVIVAAGLFGGRRDQVLGLMRGTPPRIYVAAILLMLLVQVVYNAIVLPFAHETILEDAKLFLEPLSSDAVWLYALAIVIGAPLSEELLFRGFLQSALAQTRLGFAGAALVSTLGWTALHAGYSSLGLIEVFVAGLFFSWLLWRTGNLWVPIVAHAFYNGMVMVGLLVFARA